jgi:peptidyl-tRNA hydrolase
MHALQQFNIEHIDINRIWYEKSNYLALLSVKNQEDLIKIINKAQNLNIKFSIFREPDINEEITAIALSPGKETKKLCSNIKLALKN